MYDLVSECYERLTVPFGELGEFYDDYGHRGTDYRRMEDQPVYAYRAGTIEYISKTHNLGGVIGMSIGNSQYAGWAHIIPMVEVGDRVKAGDIIGRVAGYKNLDWCGVLWDGSHIHTTLSGISSEHAALGVRPLRNPAPVITLAIANLMATAKSSQEETDMSKNVGVYINNGIKADPDPLKRSCAIFNTTSGFLTTFGGASQEYYNAMARAFGTGNFENMSEKHFNDLKEQLEQVRNGN